ncbi:hypothetical protein HKD37_U058070 [Glycine soja]
MMKHKTEKNTNLGIPRSCGFAPSPEIEQASHILDHAGFIHPTGGSCRLLPCLGIGPVSRPCDLSRKLLWGRAYKRGGTLPLPTAAETVETLVYLHLSAVVGHLLANQML